jgi:aryl-alcohol dehydrogenase
MSGFMDEEDDSTIALVVTQLGGPFEVRRVSLKDMRADEIIVRMVATGVCHTDFASINVGPGF